jgi:hypothetical protein
VSAPPFTLAIDVGSPIQDTIGWALIDALGTKRDLAQAVDRLIARLRTDGRATIGFESPIWTPRRTDIEDVTRQRQKEGKSWSIGAGAVVLADGLGIMPWVFGRIATAAPAARATISADRWRKHGGLLVWEAFVSGDAKGADHKADAKIALDAYNARWPGLESDIPAEPAVNLAVAAALASGLAIDPDEIGMAAIVIKPKRP